MRTSLAAALAAAAPLVVAVAPGIAPAAHLDAAHDLAHDSAMPGSGPPSVACAPADTLDARPGAGTEYYRIDLRPPASTLGGRDVAGRVEVSYPPSPFGLPMDGDGQLLRRLRVVVDDGWRAERGRLVAWVAAPDLDPARRLGELGEDGTVSGEVALNKYLVFVTEEPPNADATDRWQGPVVLKGKSRSGRMQSMASHGMFEREPC